MRGHDATVGGRGWTDFNEWHMNDTAAESGWGDIHWPEKTSGWADIQIFTASPTFGSSFYGFRNSVWSNSTSNLNFLSSVAVFYSYSKLYGRGQWYGVVPIIIMSYDYVRCCCLWSSRHHIFDRALIEYDTDSQYKILKTSPTQHIGMQPVLQGFVRLWE